MTLEDQLFEISTLLLFRENDWRARAIGCNTYWSADTPAAAVEGALRLRDEALAERDGSVRGGESVIAPIITGIKALPKETGTYCSVCAEEQFETRHGVTCANGHGGAPPEPVPPDTRYFTVDFKSETAIPDDNSDLF